MCAATRATHTQAELSRITRRYTSDLMPFIGPQQDIPAPDMATNEQTMAWMMDTYSVQSGHAVPEIVTGKPISIGGSVFRHEATGAGVVMVIERACERLGWRLDELRCVVQGFGNVGGIAAAELHEKGATVVGVSDVSGGVPTRTGSTSRPCTSSSRPTARSRASRERAVSNAELLALDCDMLVLAAREDQVTAENAASLRCRLVVEGANGPTSVRGDEILAERGIPVLPDVLTNAGGVTVSYFEWVQDLSRLFWDRDEIRERLAEKLGDAFDRVWDRLRARRSLSPQRSPDRGHPRRRCGARGARALSVTGGPVQQVRDAMLSDPLRLEADATAQEAGEALMRPEVRAVLVCEEGGRFTGVITRKTLVREVVAPGRDPRTTTLREIAEAPNATIESTMPLVDAFAFLEQGDLERVPVVEGGKLVGVLSRSVVQRRLVEDDPPLEPEPDAGLDRSDERGLGRGQEGVEGVGELVRTSSSISRPSASNFSCARATATSTSVTRAPIAASTLRSSACAQTPPNMPALEPITATSVSGSRAATRAGPLIRRPRARRRRGGRGR